LVAAGDGFAIPKPMAAAAPPISGKIAFIWRTASRTASSLQHDPQTTHDKTAYHKARPMIRARLFGVAAGPALHPPSLFELRRTRWHFQLATASACPYCSSNRLRHRHSARE
jgi:hypothetical protein